VRRRVQLKEPVLDLGCGAGHLLEKLIEGGFRCMAADINEKAVAMVNERFSSRPLFLGCRRMETPDIIPFGSGSVGTVFMLETIEHLPLETMHGVFREIFRVLAPGGAVVATAPFSEKLASSEVSCLSCGARFHKTQHLHSFDEEAVSETVRGAGLAVLSCEGALLLPSLPVWIRAQMTPDRISIACPECGARSESPNRSLPGRLGPLLRELRHLVCIAEKN
jgi:SAM-dependent methyltransferase